MTLPAGVLRLSRSELLAGARQELEISVHAGSRRRRRHARADAAVALGGALRRQRPAATRACRSGPRVGGRRAVPAAAGASCASPSATPRRGDAATLHDRRRRHPRRALRAALPLARGRRRGEPAAARASSSTRRCARSARRRPRPTGGRCCATSTRRTTALNESETFLTVVPGNRLRYVVGANGGGGYNAWITNTGGAAVHEGAAERVDRRARRAGPGDDESCAATRCRPPTRAGNIWYGGLSQLHERRVAEPHRRRALGARRPRRSPTRVGAAHAHRDDRRRRTSR